MEPRRDNDHRTRQVPHNLEAEESLLGAMLLSSDAIDAALDAPAVTAADFYKPAHQPIFQAIVRLARNGDPVDPITVAGELGPDITDINGRPLLGGLLSLQTNTPASANARSYAKTVRVAGETRRLIVLLTEGIETLYRGEPVGHLLEQIETPNLGASTWTPLELAPILDGDLTPPQPTILARDDGRHLLYPGRVHTFQGESESLKTWLALIAVVQEITAGWAVLYLDFEDTPESILGRLLALGARREDLLAHFTYARPTTILDLGAAHRLERLIAARGYTVAIIDGVTEAMSIEGYDLLDNKDVSTWLAHLPRRIADLGPAVAMIDHVTKSKDTRDRYAIGAQHKLAGIDGVAYQIEPIRPLAHLPDGSLEPVTGVSKITIAKDRPGAVRGFAAANRHVGELHLTAYPDGGIRGHIIPAAAIPAGGFRPTHLMERISEFLAKHGDTGLTKRAIRGAVKGKSEAKDLAIELLIAEGNIALEYGANRTQLHRLINPFDPAKEPPDEDGPPALPITAPELEVLAGGDTVPEPTDLDPPITDPEFDLTTPPDDDWEEPF